MKHRILLAATAILAASLISASAWSATPKPAAIQDAHIVSVTLLNPLHITLSGEITCTKNARFAIYAWILDHTRGALAKGKMPPKTTPGSSANAHFKAITHCTGNPQPWSLTATAAGKKPTPLGKGPATTCLTITLRKSHHYADLKQTCTTTTIH
ncbi:MAG TPA: hypothetical protein VKQ71_05990 [Acidimicrobiales bacterium]|nr:hypothetical protein [Acidimicrobiales bacterium]